MLVSPSGASVSAVYAESPAAQPGRVSSSSGRESVRSEQRQVARTARERLDQVEQVGIGPVDVLEDEDRRLLARRALEELPRRAEERVAIGRLVAGVDPDDHAEVRGDERRVRVPPREQLRRTAPRSFAATISAASLSKTPASCISCVASEP